MKIFKREKAVQIRNEYEKADIQNECTQIYDEIQKNLKKTLKNKDKLEKEYSKIEYERNNCVAKKSKAERQIKKLEEKHPIKTTIGVIPFIGNITKEGREYKRLRRKIKREKQIIKVANKNLKDLEYICKNENKEMKIKMKHLKKCEKTLKRNYKKLDKSNIEIAKTFKQSKKELSATYDKESLKYIEEYVEKVRNGEKDIKLPKGIKSSKDFMKKIKSDMKKRAKNKSQKVELKVVKSKTKAEDKSEDENVHKNTKKKDYTVENFFAKRSQVKNDVKRDYIAYSCEINGTKIELTPEETVNYVGLICKKPEALEMHSEKYLMNLTKSKVKEAADEKKAVGAEIRGTNEIIEMVKKMKNQKINKKNMSKVDKIVYSVAKEYIRREENAQVKSAPEKDDQQVAL